MESEQRLMSVLIVLRPDADVPRDIMVWKNF